MPNSVGLQKTPTARLLSVPLSELVSYSRIQGLWILEAIIEHRHSDQGLAWGCISGGHVANNTEAADGACAFSIKDDELIFNRGL